MSFYLEHFAGEKYGSQLEPSEKIQFPSHMSEEELGFIKVISGRYTLFSDAVVITHICFAIFIYKIYLWLLLISICLSIFRFAGRTNVAVSFSCEFISSGSKSWRRVYNASVSISVVPDLPLALGVPITWVLPPHYTTTSILPLSSELHGQRDHKGTIIYSLLKNLPEKNEGVQKDAISIDGDRIKTSESNNLACIQAKDRMTGRIEIAACVKVAEV